MIRSLDYKIAKETAGFTREINAVLIKVKVLSAQGTILFDVQSVPPRYVPMFVRETFEIRMFNKKIDQTSVFTQQFQLLDAKPVLQNPLKRSEEYSKKALYHNGTQFPEKFRENANLVQATTDEQEIVKKVSNK